MERRIRRMRIPKEKTQLVFKKTVNSTLSSMKTYTKTQISKIYTTDKKYVGQKIKFKKINKELGGGEIYSTHRPTFVNRFAHQENTNPGKKGGRFVSVKVLKSSSMSPISRTFIAPIKNRNGDNYGKTGVFVRIFKRNSNNRQMLRAQYAPGVTSMMNNEEVQKVVMDKTETRFDKALDTAINKVLKEMDR